jgi:hypothetical protein
MPFESEDQRKWMHANKPEMAKRWQKHTPKGKKLPKKKGKARLKAAFAIGKALHNEEGKVIDDPGDMLKHLTAPLENAMREKKQDEEVLIRYGVRQPLEWPSGGIGSKQAVHFMPEGKSLAETQAQPKMPGETKGGRKVVPQKLSKKFAGYANEYWTTDGKRSNFTCNECVMFLTKGACSGVAGKIEPHGACDLFMAGPKNAQKEMPVKIPQTIAVYVEHEPGFTCKRCEVFEPGNRAGSAGACKWVDGSIHPDACCNLWYNKAARYVTALDKEVHEPHVREIQGQLGKERTNRMLKTKKAAAEFNRTFNRRMGLDRQKYDEPRKYAVAAVRTRADAYKVGFLRKLAEEGMTLTDLESLMRSGVPVGLAHMSAHPSLMKLNLDHMGRSAGISDQLRAALTKRAVSGSILGDIWRPIESTVGGALKALGELGYLAVPLALAAPVAAGALTGAGHAYLTRPAEADIETLRKQQLLALYRRIAAETKAKTLNE